MVVSFPSCKKSSQRTCFKSTGAESMLEIDLDSVHTFHLFKNIRYRIFQDNERKIVVRGGENLIQHIELVNENGILSVHNNNRCNFLRDAESIPEVEIHYPHFNRFYIEPSDSVVFENTISGDSLQIEMREGGGSAKLGVNVNFLSINVSYGTGDYTISGQADNAEVKVQNNGFANAADFNATNLFLYNNSTGDLHINLAGTNVLALLEGTGNIFYSGAPASIEKTKLGIGDLIEE